MINNNQAVMGISTDYGIATILGNFSEDFIKDTIRESIDYRFRPYGLRSPNYPEILNSQLESVKANSIGYDDQIEDKRVEVFQSIIDTINEYYGLQVVEDIPDEQIYSIAYIMFQLFVSEFTDRMINFYTQYIINNMENILGYIQNVAGNQKTSKTAYAKKLYNNENYITIYDNMNLVVDILASLDIELPILVEYLSDQATSNLLCNYIGAIDDVYKNRFASFILDSSTRADIITAVKFKFVQTTVENTDLYDPNNTALFKDPN